MTILDKKKVFLVDLRAKEALISQRRRRRFLICKLHFELDANMPFSIFGGNLVLKYRLSDVGPILPRLATFAVRPRVIYLASRRLNPRLSRPCISESEWSRAARAHSLNNHACNMASILGQIARGVNSIDINLNPKIGPKTGPRCKI